MNKEKCFHHPGKKATITIDGKTYCDNCKADQAKAVANVKLLNRHITPAECFIEYKNRGDGWVGISGTGCAHWVSHQIGLKNRKLSAPRLDDHCLVGNLYRVTTLVHYMGNKKIERKDVKVGDIWVDVDEEHTGLVVAVQGKGTKITIRHDSSRQGGVRENDLDSHWHGDDKGTFYRYEA